MAEKVLAVDTAVVVMEEVAILAEDMVVVSAAGDMEAVDLAILVVDLGVDTVAAMIITVPAVTAAIAYRLVSVTGKYWCNLKISIK